MEREDDKKAEAMKERFAAAIRSARAGKDFTQNQLAGMSGVRRNSISDWERGENLPAGVISAARLCEALGISLDEALGL